MQTKFQPVLRALLLATSLTLIALAGLAPAKPAQAQKSIESFFQTGLKDLTAELEVVSKNDAELKKIGKGYTDAYSMAHKTFWYKEPGKVRFEGKKGLFNVKMITAGDKKLTQYALYRKVEDLKKEPGQADSISDIGLLTPDWLPDHDYVWVRTEKKDGKDLDVFEFWDKRDPKYKHTMWVDPQTKTIVEHIAHHRAKKLKGFKKRFVFSNVKQINGVWVPTEVTVYSTDNKAAGTMRYNSIKVNTNLPDSLFKI
jgi:outer membrane lipoprotein-sorting protein